MAGLLEEAMESIEEELNPTAEHDGVETERSSVQSFRLEDLLPNLDFILAETGEGSIEDYLEHPLNSRKSKGLAQILRGMTGLLGNLNYAVIDIFLGFFEFSKEKGQNHEQAAYSE